MSDLISRQAAIDAFIEWYGFEPNDMDYFVEILAKQPSAQPEIIRCKDCKHWYDAPATDGYNSCELDALIRHKDFYCANAERRSE